VGADEALIRLPIDEVLPDVIAALRGASSLVLQAPTGAGKTTRVPPALLDAGIAGDKRVVMLEPRRLAARAAARRIAEERGGRVGDEIGWHVRFDRKASHATRVLVVTEGLLVRMLQDDPFLEDVGAVVVDEFHERSLHADLALAMVRRVQQEARPDLRVVVMSATLDAAPVAAFLDAPVVTSEGRSWPVTVRYLPFPDTRFVEVAVAEGVRKALSEVEGTVLAFLPGVGEIRRTADELGDIGVPVRLLYGDLPLDQQDAVLKAGSRQVVLATNVAETSLTIPGVAAVVDSGWARVMRQDPATGLDRLELVRIGKASADQRAGRAGREGPGLCLRLWTEREQNALREREDAEIRRVDLAGPVLELMCWGERDVDAFPWFEPPPPVALEHARSLLDQLGAIGPAGVTPLGRTLARLPVHPRLGRLLVEGHRLGWPRPAALLAAVLSDRDPLRAEREARHRSRSDALDRVDALEAFERREGGPAVDRDAARFVLRARDQLLDTIGRDLGPPGPSIDRDEGLLRAVLAGWPDRVARARPTAVAPGVPPGHKGRMVGGRGVRLDRRSAVDAELFVCVDLDAGEREALVRIASEVEEEWLPAERIETVTELRWEDAAERVVAVKVRRYFDLPLAEAPAPLPDEDAVATALAEAAASRLERALGLDGEEVAGWLGRVRFLAAAMPDLGLPTFTDDDLRDRLPALCRGRRSFAQLRQDALGALQEQLTWAQRQALDREAPERLEVPSGSHVKVTYEPGRPPVMAVRMQELFGLPETPRVAGGRVKVLLHLLAPNQRPQQITDDLASFWANTWPEVRKELRARYPKHSWPEDPWNAPPEARPKRRR
jgi:ATP-dependent helicase HrpB